MAMLYSIKQKTGEQSENAVHSLGDQYIDHYGRTWVYSVASAGVTQFNSLGLTAAVGADVVTDAAAAITVKGKTYATGKQLYKSSVGWTVGTYTGYLGLLDDGTAEAAAITTAFLVEGNSADTLYVDWNNNGAAKTLAAADDDIEMFNPNSVIQFPANGQTTTPCVGVAPITVTAAYYFWRQTRGICFVLVEGADPTEGQHATVDAAGTTAGNTMAAAAGDEMDDVSIVGTLTSLSSETSGNLGAWVWLNIGY